METELTNDTKKTEPTKQNLIWLLLLTSILSGIAVSITPVVTETISGLYHVPGFGVISGAVGGISAGMIQVFSWKISKTIKTVLYITLIVSVGFLLFVGGSEYFLIWLFTMIPGVVSFFAVYFVTKTISIQLTKSPVNWWLFGFLLVVGVIISIAAIGFLSVFSAMFMAQ